MRLFIACMQALSLTSFVLYIIVLVSVTATAAAATTTAMITHNPSERISASVLAAAINSISLNINDGHCKSNTIAHPEHIVLAARAN